MSDENKKNYDPVVIDLVKPISLSDKDSPVSTLTFYEATLGDLIHAEKAGSEMEKMGLILARMARIDHELMAQVGARDLSEIMDKAEHLMGN